MRICPECGSGLPDDTPCGCEERFYADFDNDDWEVYNTGEREDYEGEAETDTAVEVTQWNADDFPLSRMQLHSLALGRL